jgi:hypothetical protein
MDNEFRFDEPGGDRILENLSRFRFEQETEDPWKHNAPWHRTAQLLRNEEHRDIWDDKPPSLILPGITPQKDGFRNPVITRRDSFQERRYERANKTAEDLISRMPKQRPLFTGFQHSRH